MPDNILNIANKYAGGLADVLAKRDAWLKKQKELKDHLKQIADHLNHEAAYKPGFYIDTLHAWNDDIKGNCAEMPSVTFRSGEMPMQVIFRNPMGERKELMEQGFHITFSPTVTGQVVAFLLPHYSDLDEKAPEHATLAVIDNPARLTMNVVDEIIARGMEAAFHTSFTSNNEEEEEKEEEPRIHHNPIGFKRYETTEKVK